MIRSSFALYCLNHLSVVNSISSNGWPKTLSFKFFKTRPTSSSTRIRAFALIPCMEYAVVFPSISVNSFILGFIEDGSSCATHSVVLFQDYCFLSMVCCSVSSSPSTCAMKNCSLSAKSEEDSVTSTGVVCTFSLILRRIFSVTFNANREKKPAAVFTDPAIFAFLKLNWST